MFTRVRAGCCGLRGFPPAPGFGRLHSLRAILLPGLAVRRRPKYREALSKINRAGVSGIIIKTPSGILRRSPLMDVIRDLALEMKGYEAEMGFTPAARLRISLPAESTTESDPWSEIAG
ncbi:P27 family phage terminase small subunit [Candidatus Accumulibacter sp. ACC003]|uniref:P27 family phage terminase small subunit n=1 Tax=Candidatus Accumulibacter sp. ACC003 TaxID=2823334 RepID=UPI0025B92251|nr:P27 family phage terminase small subunit [Candidatus Accumulibacter sp. ACC003]